MERLPIIVSQGTRNRIQRIKELRRLDAVKNGKEYHVLDDQEIVTAAIGAYWLLKEREAAKNALHPRGEPDRRTGTEPA
jgi:hypothetical protein